MVEFKVERAWERAAMGEEWEGSDSSNMLLLPVGPKGSMPPVVAPTAAMVNWILCALCECNEVQRVHRLTDRERE